MNVYKKIDYKYVFKMVMVSLVQVFIVSKQIDNRFNICMGAGCIYYDNPGLMVLNIFPFTINILLLFNFLDQQLLSTEYCFNRYGNIKDYINKYLFNNLITHILIYISIFVLSLKLTIIDGFYSSFFYIINNTMCCAIISLVYLYMNMLLNRNKTINNIFIFFLVLLIFTSRILYSKNIIYSLILLLPVTHLCLFEKKSDYIISSFIGIVYFSFIYITLRLRCKKIDVFY